VFIYKNSIRLLLCLAVITLTVTISSPKVFGEQSQNKITEGFAMVVPSVYISQIGGMVGSFSTISYSKYIGSTGIVQVSKEENNGVIHSFKVGHINKTKLSNKTINNYITLKRKANISKADSPIELTEYYSPKTMICILAPQNVICDYYEKSKIPEFAKAPINLVENIAAHSSLSQAKPGLYVRAQQIPDAKENFIQADARLEALDCETNKALCEIIKNEMALIRVSEERAPFELTDNIKLEVNKPFYIEINEIVYLFNIYSYKESRK